VERCFAGGEGWFEYLCPTLCTRRNQEREHYEGAHSFPLRLLSWQELDPHRLAYKPCRMDDRLILTASKGSKGPCQPPSILTWSTRRCLGTHPATWLTTAASSPTPTPQDCARLRLVHFSSVRHGPSSMTEPSLQWNLQFGTICCLTSDSQTCHTAASDSH